MSEFEDFPNEILVKVLTYLKVDEIVRCHLLSRRIRALCHHVSLWKKINIHNMDDVPAKLLQDVLSNGCQYLSLNCSTVEGNLVMNKSCQLRYLDMTTSEANNKSKERLLASCHSLEKISLMNTPLNKKMMNSIFNQNGKTLQILNLSGCSGINMESFPCCVNLVELNLGRIDENISANQLTDFLSSKLEKLSLRDVKSIRDKHIKKLVTRCKKLRILDLGGTSIGDESITTIKEKLNPSLEELDVSHTSINFFNILRLRQIPNLRALHCWHLGPVELSAVKRHLTNVEINDLPMVVADSEQNFDPEDGIWDVECKQSLN